HYGKARVERQSRSHRDHELADILPSLEPTTAEAFMKRSLMLVAVLAFARAAAAQAADDYRGGWRTDSGEAHVYEFSIRGATVRGIYCTYCADATTLALLA